MESGARILDGRLFAEQISEQVAAKVIARKEAGLAQPGLATILVGEDAASQVYVRNKHRACEKVGIQSFAYELAADSAQSEVLQLIQELNKNPDVHGMLLQELIAAISPLKDVDGLHPENVGLLAQKGREVRFAPATPSGIMRLLDEAGVKLEGANAVVLGRSNIVGLPISLMLLEANATVTICHSRSKDLAAICRQADVLITAVGRPEFVRADWVKAGAVVIDVGVNRVEDSSRKRGYRLVGDVDFDEVSKVAAAITPVPGGVGPMTIAMLLENTLNAAKLND
jgi:5,10-methylene-tetrahydrofolate dehydrogenase/methenyl tetrahydrofolate cyclohydrolase